MYLFTIETQEGCYTTEARGYGVSHAPNALCTLHLDGPRVAYSYALVIVFAVGRGTGNAELHKF